MWHFSARTKVWQEMCSASWELGQYAWWAFCKPNLEKILKGGRREPRKYLMSNTWNKTGSAGYGDSVNMNMWNTERNRLCFMMQGFLSHYKNEWSTGNKQKELEIKSITSLDEYIKVKIRRMPLFWRKHMYVEIHKLCKHEDPLLAYFESRSKETIMSLWRDAIDQQSPTFPP